MTLESFNKEVIQENGSVNYADALAYMINSAKSGRVRILEAKWRFEKALKNPKVVEALYNAKERGVEVQAVLCPPYHEPYETIVYVNIGSIMIPVPERLFNFVKKLSGYIR